MPSPISRLLGILRFGFLNLALPLLAAWGVIRLANGDFRDWSPASFERIDGPYGALNLRLQLPGNRAGIPEPLLTIGKPGDATFVFIRLLPEGKAKIGVEFWGYFSDEGPVFALPTDRDVVTVKITVPALHPAKLDPAWRFTTERQQAYLQSHYAVTVDGAVRVRGQAPAKTMATGPVVVGANPIGGSLVSERFTGQVLQRWRDY